MKARVNANGVRLYESNSPISAAKGFAKHGEELDIEAEFGSWCKLADGRWVEACFMEAVDVSGGGGGASSWNDLEDRPFGEIEEETELLPETVVTLIEEDMMVGAFFDDPCVPEEGKEYVVYWQGSPYRVTCVAFGTTGDMFLCLGNLSISTDGEDTGEPFLYSYSVDHEVGYIFTSSAAGDYTVRITETVAGTKTIDPKYLPFLIITAKDGNSFEANMSFEEVVTMFDNRTLAGGCVYDKYETLMPIASIMVSSDYVYIESFSGIRLSYCSDGTISEAPEEV